MNRLIIVGSPRVDGRSAQLADLLFEACIDECPEDELALAPVSTLNISPCRGCDACRALVEQAGVPATDGAHGEKAASSDETPARCVIQDDMVEVYEFIDAADEIIVVSPVYFAGPPAQLKALFDRLQPYFWANARHAPKRPATLHIVGEGGDPHGFDPLIGITRSVLSCTGFELERMVDWVGKIDQDGEITAEADEYILEPLGSVDKQDTACHLIDFPSSPECNNEDEVDGEDFAFDAAPTPVSTSPSKQKPARPVLSVAQHAPLPEDQEAAQGQKSSPAKKGGQNKASQKSGGRDTHTRSHQDLSRSGNRNSAHGGNTSSKRSSGQGASGAKRGGGQSNRQGGKRRG